MKKRGLKPQPLSVPRECKLGEGITQVTHEFKGDMEIVGKKVLMSFYVIHGKLSQGIVLGYSFLSEHKACIDFSSKEKKLGDTDISCLKHFIEPMFVKTKKEARNPKKIKGKYAIYCMKKQAISTICMSSVKLGWKY